MYDDWKSLKSLKWPSGLLKVISNGAIPRIPWFARYAPLVSTGAETLYNRRRIFILCDFEVGLTKIVQHLIKLQFKMSVIVF